VSALGETESATPRVSVIITSLNAEATVTDCIRSITSQDYPNLEVIFVDAGSTDDTTSKALMAAGNTTNFRLVIDKSASTPARGRNKGAEVAKGDFLAFTDSDCIAEPDWIRGLTDPENWKEHVGAVGGKTVFTEIPHEKGILVALHGALGTRLGSGGSIEFFNRPKLSSAKSLPACNVMYPSKIFKTSGGFDESLRYCEDSCLSARIRRAGFRLVYTPKAVIHHRHRNSVRQFVRWMFDYGKGRGEAVKKDRGAITVAAVLLMLIPLLILGLALWRVLPWDILLVSTLAIYFGLDLAYALARTRRPQGETLLYFASYLVIHLSYVAGLVGGLVRRRTGSGVSSSPTTTT
jgi:glycosyltransferase involved in cell wall biosynthesis